MSKNNTVHRSKEEAKTIKTTGKWIYHENELYCVRWNKWECSECHKRRENKSNFCPDCGADMRGEQNE